MRNIIHKEINKNLTYVSNLGSEETENAVVIELLVEEEFLTNYDYKMIYTKGTTTGEVIVLANEVTDNTIEFEIPVSVITTSSTENIEVNIQRKKTSETKYSDLNSFNISQNNLRIFSVDDFIVKYDEATEGLTIVGASSDTNGPCVKTMRLNENLTCSTSNQNTNVPLSNYTMVGKHIGHGINPIYNVYGIIVGAGFNHVLVNAIATVQNKNSSDAMNVNLYIVRYRDGVNTIIAIGRVHSLAAGGTGVAVIPNILLETKAGDIYTMRINKTTEAGKLEVISTNRTALTVQKVD